MRSFLIVFATFIAINCFAVVEPAQVFKQAEDLYKKNDYKGARDLYLPLYKDGYSGKELFFNLGNCYFKSGDLGYAIAFYEKALKLDPADEDIAANLKLANSKTTDKMNTEVKGLARWFKQMLNLFSSDSWTFYGIACWLTAFIGLILSVSGFIQFSAFTRNFTVIILFAGSVFLFMGFLQYRNVSISRHAVIVSPMVEVKATPDTEAKKLYIIHEGTKVNFHDTNNEWIEISIDNENYGWINADDAILI